MPRESIHYRQVLIVAGIRVRPGSSKVTSPMLKIFVKLTSTSCSS